MKRPVFPKTVFCIALVVFVTATASQPPISASPPMGAMPRPQDSSREKYRKQHALFEKAAAARHLVIADWCADKGLFDQAMEQCRLAVSLTGGGYRTPETRALRRLESLTPSQIERGFHRPTKKEMKTYGMKAAKAIVEDRKGRKKLADMAYSKKEHLLKEALEEYDRLIRESDGLLPFDGKGRIVLDIDVVPEPVSMAYREEAKTILVNGKLYLRDQLFSHMEGVGEVSLEDSEGLQVFCTGNLEEAIEYSALGRELLARLEKDLDSSPREKLVLFLFADRSDYEGYCDATENGCYKVVQGFSSLGDSASLICTEDGDGERLSRFQTQCIVLHELVHLFHFSLTGMSLPSWYEEGLSETYGGAGVFSWRDGKLTTGGLLAGVKLAVLKQPDGLIALDEFLAIDAAGLNNIDCDKASRFYIQSWAFVRYLGNGAGKTSSRKLDKWVEKCHADKLAPAAATVLFREIFARDLPGMERKFLKYLKKL
jgi:hypothetical protein